MRGLEVQVVRRLVAPHEELDPVVAAGIEVAGGVEVQGHLDEPAVVLQTHVRVRQFRPSRFTVTK